MWAFFGSWSCRAKQVAVQSIWLHLIPIWYVIWMLLMLFPFQMMPITSQCEISNCSRFSSGMPFNRIEFHYIPHVTEKIKSKTWNIFFRLFFLWFNVKSPCSKSCKNKLNKKKKKKKHVPFPLRMESTTHVQVNQYSFEHCIKETFFLH